MRKGDIISLARVVFKWTRTVVSFLIGKCSVLCGTDGGFFFFRLE